MVKIYVVVASAKLSCCPKIPLNAVCSGAAAQSVTARLVVGNPLVLPAVSTSIII